MAKITTQITVIHYERCHNLGNYEHEKIRVEAIVGTDDSPSDVIADLRRIVLNDIEAADRERENKWLMRTGWSNYSRATAGVLFRDPFLNNDYRVLAKDEGRVNLVLLADETKTCTVDAKAIESWQIIGPDAQSEDDFDPMAEDDDEPQDDWPDGPPTE